jgi:hypothetical protein
MSETKDEIAADRDRLQAENENLRGQLAAAGATRTAGQAPPAQHRFQLSEGDRQELEIRGVVNIGGRLWTRDEVLAEMARTGPDAAGHNDQSAVEIAEAPEGTRIDPGLLPGRTGPGIAGVDFVYPSVERGKIDPAVAGTPGISGPAAGEPTEDA